MYVYRCICAQLFHIFVMILWDVDTVPFLHYLWPPYLRFRWSSAWWLRTELQDVPSRRVSTSSSTRVVTNTAETQNKSAAYQKAAFFFLPESVLLMPTWYWCNKTRPDFYGNSPFFFSVYNIVRVETYPWHGNQRQFFVVKILLTFQFEKGLWAHGKISAVVVGKKGKSVDGRDGGKGTIEQFFVLYDFIYLRIFTSSFILHKAQENLKWKFFTCHVEVLRVHRTRKIICQEKQKK